MVTEGLDPAVTARLRLLVQSLDNPRAPTSVRDSGEAWRVHVADSLSALEVEELTAARLIADLGAGAGFPGLALALALPEARVDLIEANGRKCEFMREAIAAAGIDNARVVAARSEDWAAAAPPAGGREAYDAVTARAVSSLASNAELASPLLREGGVLVTWKGERRPDEESLAARTAPQAGMAPVKVVPVTPYPESRHRHLHVVRKAGPTPQQLPRRPGAAAKRPLGS